MLNRTTILLARTSGAGFLLFVWLVFFAPLLRADLLPGIDGHYDKVPRQVSLIIEEDRLLASNVRLSTIDAIEFAEGEKYLRHAESQAAIAVLTDLRILAYGPVIGWRSLDLLAGEQLESLQVADYAVFIITNRRYVNFNADSGVWAQQRRSAE